MKKILYCLALALFVTGTAITAHAVSMSAVGSCSSVAPSITITSPNGREVYKNTQQIPIAWKTCNMTSSDLIGIHVNVYSDGQIIDGTATPSIATGTSIVYNTGSATLTAPNTWGGISSLPSGAYYRISLTRELPGSTIYSGSSDTDTTDLSNNLFSIIAGSSIGGGTYAPGCTAITAYSSTTGQPCSAPITPSIYPAGCMSTIGYSRTTGQPCSSAATVSNYPAGCTSSWGYSRTTGQSCNGTVAMPITTTPTATPSITVLSPSGATVYQPGQQLNVAWTSTGVSSSTLLEINVSNGTSLFGFLEPNGTPNSGYATVTLPTGMSAGSYQIIVGVPQNNDFTNSSLSVSGSSYFTVGTSATATTQPSVTLLSQYGASYASGQQIAAAWTYQGLPSSMQVAVFVAKQEADGSYDHFTLLGSPSLGTNQGRYTIPSTITPGGNYVVFLNTGPQDGGITSKSTPFTIGSSASSTTGPAAGSQASMIAQLIAFPTGSNLHTDLGCNGTRYSTTTGAICDGTENTVSSAFTGDATPRIMEWYSKVNQHIDASGIWQTDPDGTSGGQIDPLTYCKKWYPNTVSVKPYKTETIATWHEAGNVNNWRYTATSVQCVSGNQDY